MCVVLEKRSLGSIDSIASINGASQVLLVVLVFVGMILKFKIQCCLDRLSTKKAGSPFGDPALHQTNN